MILISIAEAFLNITNLSTLTGKQGNKCFTQGVMMGSTVSFKVTQTSQNLYCRASNGFLC